jgi:hypothetical protein
MMHPQSLPTALPGAGAGPKEASNPRSESRGPRQARERSPLQGLQEAPELPHPPMQRGRLKPHYIGEHVREEPLSVAQERALRLDTSQLLEVSEKDDLGVHKSLEGCVASSTGVEQRVSVVYEPPRDKERQQRGRAEATSASGTVQVRFFRGTSDCAIRCPLVQMD